MHHPMHYPIVTSSVAIGLLTFAAHWAAADEAASRSTCEELAALGDPADPAFRVDAAEWQTASQSPGPAAAPVPAHCLLRVTLDARPSSIEGVALGIGFELRLPLEWNGRFLFQGGGGLNGALNPAFGNVSGAPSALARGFAVVSTDGGHRGRSIVDSSFAADQQAKLDFAYQAVQRTAYESKDIIDRFYGRAPEYSYFMGC